MTFDRAEKGNPKDKKKEGGEASLKEASGKEDIKDPGVCKDDRKEERDEKKKEERDEKKKRDDKEGSDVKKEAPPTNGSSGEGDADKEKVGKGEEEKKRKSDNEEITPRGPTSRYTFIVLRFLCSER